MLSPLNHVGANTMHFLGYYDFGQGLLDQIQMTKIVGNKKIHLHGHGRKGEKIIVHAWGCCVYNISVRTFFRY